MTETDCIFCKIIQGEIPSTTVHDDELVTAFRDINPVAPTHILIVPKKHIEDNNAFEAGADDAVAARLFAVAKQLAQAEGIAESGYRLIMNCGSDGGQEIQHLHLHLIGGRKMQYPMG
ncbi:MAG: histidine triad nucleotide-binding protein [Anaerolineales bacterium]|nr:histidine triad nucleotide-binding protein [Anaerolineales bacterium]